MIYTILLLFLLVVLASVNIWLNLKKTPGQFPSPLHESLVKLEAALARIEPLLRDEFSRNRAENRHSFKESREELGQAFRDSRMEQGKSLKSFEEQFENQIRRFGLLQKEQFNELFTKQENIKAETAAHLREIRETVENKLGKLQDANDRRLEEMRKTVDEKLQESVEKRFNESFRLISDRLEQVHKGLGEMQHLATGVGDLKKVLANVKTRGNLGEIRLGAILEQILSPEQYVVNASCREGSAERVEFAVKLPGKSGDGKAVLLPVDSKYPNEDYQRLLDAYEAAGTVSPKELEAVGRQFENSVRKNAKDIRDRYINPPLTTDFAIMFVPTEGLYAEILRRTGLFESLQRDYKISVVGPSNLVAFLNSLQMGFRTLAIEKRSGEVWQVLGAVKTEFGNFGQILDKTKKKLEEAANVIDKAGVRTRAIERKLRDVQELPAEEAEGFLE